MNGNEKYVQLYKKHNLNEKEKNLIFFLYTFLAMYNKYKKLERKKKLKDYLFFAG